MLVLLLALSFVMLSVTEVFGESAFFDTIRFIQYLDESTALEEVRNGNLDMYYYRISSDRLERQIDRKGLQVFDSTSGSYSILVNPADSDKFNPFSKKEIRFALNYLIDRKLVVDELMGGYGTAMISYYGPYDPEYFTVIKQLEKYEFRYDPALADKIISNALTDAGAIKDDAVWMINNNPIEITIFIRSDDPIRKSIGEILSSELQQLGFIVHKEFGDLNKAYAIVYGTDPLEQKWHIYTEGWSRTAFTKYDVIGLGQMYSPWFANMPGFNIPSYWNYKNEYIDSITQKIYTGDFKSTEERNSLIQEALVEGIEQSVRIFLASKIDQYVANEKISGIVNDFGAGITSRFTPINANGNKEELVIGVKQIYQGAWNPVGGFSDSYSRHIWNVISDPVTFKHPFSGETIPIRADWKVESAGPEGKINVPPDAIIWNPKSHGWVHIGEGKQTTSKVTFDFKWSKWHNGQMMDMKDILHALYFTIEWGTQTDENDKTVDAEFTPRASQAIQTIVGVKPIDDDTIEIYVDYWHFDENEIAEWASIWSVIPWEITESMEQAVVDGKLAFSRAEATNKNVSWMSLIIPKDAKIIQEYLNTFEKTKHIPISLQDFDIGDDYYNSRYSASMQWIQENNHAIISNGPFYLKTYSPESRTIVLNNFKDESYPFESGHWSEFENPKFPKITKIEVPEIITRDKKYAIPLETVNSDAIIYFVSNNRGEVVISESFETSANESEIVLTSNITRHLELGANNLKIFAISDKVLKPDYFMTSFFVTENQETLPKTDYIDNENNVQTKTEYWWILIVIFFVILMILILRKSIRLRNRTL